MGTRCTHSEGAGHVLSLDQGTGGASLDFSGALPEVDEEGYPSISWFALAVMGDFAPRPALPPLTGVRHDDDKELPLEDDKDDRSLAEENDALF